MKIVCIGQKTNDALNQYHMSADFIPSVADSDILNKELKEIVGNEKVFLARGHLPVGFNLDCEELYVYKNSEVEISIDKYPFGYALEIESINSDERAEQIISNWCEKIGLDIKKSYRLSWDDKYEELCKEQNVVKYNEVTFDKDMPKIVD
jgi:hypothetical protein